MSDPRIDRARLRALLDRSVRVYSPSGAETEAQRLHESALRGAGLEVERQSVPRAGAPERANLIAQLGPSPPSLLLLGHLDTVALEPGETLAPRWEGETLVGLGAADMKGGCAALVEAICAVRETGAPLARGARIALVVGEEDDGDGAWALFERERAPLVVIGEPTSLVPCVEHFGYLELELAVTGRRAHAALPEHGASAIEGMVDWLGAIRASLAATEAVPSVRSIQGGGEMFAVAERCRAVLDVHLPAEASPGVVQERVALASRRLAEAGLSASCQRVLWAPGDGAAPDSEALAPVRRALARCGLEGEPSAFRSHSDANLLYGRDSVAVVLGPGRLEHAHTRVERVELDEVVRAAELYACLILEACADF